MFNNRNKEKYVYTIFPLSMFLLQFFWPFLISVCALLIVHWIYSAVSMKNVINAGAIGKLFMRINTFHYLAKQKCR